MQFNETARRYHEDGFAVVRGFFSPDQLAKIESALDIVVHEIAPTLPKGQVYYEDTDERSIKSMFQLEDLGETFHSLLEHPDLLGLARTVFDDPAMGLRTVMYFGKGAHCGSLTPPHQDNFYQCFEPPEGMRITIAVDASTADNGPLTCQKGTHRLGVLPHRPSDVLGFSQILVEVPDVTKYPDVEICLDPGDICLHATNTVHHSGPNRTDHPRRQLAIECCSTRVRQNEKLLDERREAVARLHQKHHETR
jgi:phytanoyl-CoA hydroxylase